MASGPSPASSRACLERLREQWPAFRARVELLLARSTSRRIAGTRIVTTILRDLCTTALDWPRSSIHARLGSSSDLVLSIKRLPCLIVEARAPHSIRWDMPGGLMALDRLRRYADEHAIKCIAISDGIRLYAAELHGGVLQHRLYVSLVSDVPPAPLWWLSVSGIHRPSPTAPAGPMRVLPSL